MLEKYFPSSRDENKVSLTVRGVGLALATIVLAFAPALGLEGVDQTFITQVTEAVTTFFQQVFAAASTLMIIWGLVRKLIPTRAEMDQALKN